MVATTGPNLGLIDNEDIGENWYTELTRLLRGVDGLVQPSAISQTVVTPPGSPSEGDTYIVGIGATGAWATHDGKIARYTTRNALNTWEFFTPKQNWIIGVEDEGVSGVLYRYTGTVWELLQTSGGASGGSAGGEKLYFSSTDYLADSAVTIGIDELTTSPTEVTPVDLTQTVNNSTEMIGPAFLDGEIGSTTLSGGEWTFDWYRFVDNTTQVTNIITSVYIHSSEAGTLTTTGTGTSRTATISGGTPFVAGDVNGDNTKSAWIVTPTAQLRITGFTSSSEVTVECLSGYVNESAVAYSKNTYLLQAVSEEINDTSIALEEKLEVVIDTAVNATDKIMVRNWARTTANSDITVTLRYGGADHYSNIHTPIPFSHNNLRLLQGGNTSERYHHTSAEHSAHVYNNQANAFSDNVQSGLMLKDVGSVVTDKGNSGTTTQTFDYTEGSYQKVTSTGNHTFAFSNFPPSGNAGYLMVEYVNAGAFTLTAPTVNWIKSDGSFTTAFGDYLTDQSRTLQASGTDFFLFWSRDGGTTYYGVIV